MEFFFTSFGSHNPFIKSPLPEHAIYPISAHMGAGIDLDYTSLLLGQSYTIDSEAFDYVVNGDRSFLVPMRKTLTFLRREGLLKIVDYGDIVKRKESTLKD